MKHLITVVCNNQFSNRRKQCICKGLTNRLFSLLVTKETDKQYLESIYCTFAVKI